MFEACARHPSVPEVNADMGKENAGVEHEAVGDTSPGSGMM
jgi:hypothetical protein